ncbi:hypothetical protein [Mycobacterium sp. 050134]|uniref:hypothetical protein n=1 Tax=Mycobacterium sp. 050134 TaxID=3096111 RepID=UPI002ED790BB
MNPLVTMLRFREFGCHVQTQEHVGAAAPQGATELSQFLQDGGTPRRSVGDDRGHHGLAAAPVGVGVGGDELLVSGVCRELACPGSDVSPLAYPYAHLGGATRVRSSIR